jgi:glyoxylase I family protein
MGITVQGVCPLLQVFDMPTSIAFYRDLLGFEIVERSTSSDDCDWAWLRLNDAELMLNTAYERHNRPEAPDPARIAAHKDIGLFFGCPDVDEVYTYLREQGLDVKAPTLPDYGMKQLYVWDPDGYCLCFQWPA